MSNIVRVKIDEKIAKAAVYGGAFLGGGGGGDLREGLRTIEIALSLGDIYIVSIDEIPREAYIATASIVGAPAAKERYVKYSHMIKAFELLIEAAENTPIKGIISSENGGASTTNGWIPAAALELPIVDAPADGRAHPSGVMGSMGLHKRVDYVSVQAGVGGDKSSGRYIEIVVRGSLERADKLIREAAVQAGGMIAVARNPVERDYVAENAAVGGLSKAIELGEIIIKNISDPIKLCEEVIRHLGGGEILDRGVVVDKSLRTVGGYDVGEVVIQGSRDNYLVTFWNEYMTIESRDKILAAFPDLIVTLDAKTSLPLTSAEIKKGDEVFLVSVPKQYIPLGSGVKDPDILRSVESIIGKRIL